MTRHHPTPAEASAPGDVDLDETSDELPVPDEPTAPPVAEADEADPAEEPVRDGPETPPGHSRPPAAVVALLVVLLVCALAGGTVLLLQKRATATAEDDRAGALQAARQMVVNLMTLDHNAPQESLDRVTQGATGQFREQFSTQASAIQTILQQAAVSSSGEVSEAGVAQLDRDSATVLVASTALVKNTQAPQGEPRQYRMLIKLQKQADNWLASDVEFVP
jgi:Mce-associated membrane protein